MLVQVLYFEGCPHHRPALELVREVISECGAEAVLEEVEVATAEAAERLRFLGSPSIRVDGVDIEPGAETQGGYALSCRMYGGSGVPPRELLVGAIVGEEPR